MRVRILLAQSVQLQCLLLYAVNRAIVRSFKWDIPWAKKFRRVPEVVFEFLIFMLAVENTRCRLTRPLDIDGAGKLTRNFKREQK